MEKQLDKKSSRYVRRNILTALYQLMLEKPFSEIRIQDIAQRAGVPRVSYYRNYKSKEDILDSYMLYETSRFHELHSGEEEEEYLTHLLAHLKTFKDKFELLYKNNLSYLISEHIYQWCGPLKETEDSEAYLLSAKSYAVFGFIDEWIKRGMNGEPNEVAKELLKDLEGFNLKVNKIKL